MDQSSSSSPFNGSDRDALVAAAKMAAAELKEAKREAKGVVRQVKADAKRQVKAAKREAKERVALIKETVKQAKRAAKAAARERRAE